MTTFATAAELAKALRRAADAHHGYEELLGRRDEDWADWYADFIMREQASKRQHTAKRSRPFSMGTSKPAGWWER